MGVAADKINVLIRNGKMRSGGQGNVFPPLLDGFGVINPGTGKKAEPDVLSFLVNTFKAKTPVFAKRSFEVGPISLRNVNCFYKFKGFYGRFELSISWVAADDESMELVPFSLIGDEQINNIVNIGDGAYEGSKSFGAGIEIVSPTAGNRADFFPSSNIDETSRRKNVGILTHREKMGTINDWWKAVESVGKSGSVKAGRIITKRVEDGFHF